MELIDGYAGKPHIEASQVGDFNLGIVGLDRYVLDVGNNFKCDVVTNNKITIADGILVNQGRRCSIPYGTMENIIIENGSQILNRNDIVCCHYIKDDATTIETVEIVVLKGTEATTAKDPDIPKGNIRAGALEDYFPLYRVKIEKLSIVGVDTLFRVLESLDHHISNDKNPHKVTKAQVGLSNVDNTADSAKDVAVSKYMHVQNWTTGEWRPNSLQALYSPTQDMTFLYDANGKPTYADRAINLVSIAGVPTTKTPLLNPDAGRWYSVGQTATLSKGIWAISVRLYIDPGMDGPYLIDDYLKYVKARLAYKQTDGLWYGVGDGTHELCVPIRSTNSPTFKSASSSGSLTIITNCLKNTEYTVQVLCPVTIGGIYTSMQAYRIGMV